MPTVNESIANFLLSQGVPPGQLNEMILAFLQDPSTLALLTQAQLVAGATGVVASAENNRAVLPDGTLAIVGGTRTSQVRYGAYGDSIKAYASLPAGSDTFSVERITFPFPASSASSFVKNKNRFLLQDLYPKCVIVADCGISGQTTTQMLARESAAASVTRRAVADLISLNLDIIEMSGGSINNLLSVTSENWRTTADTCISEATTLIYRCMTLGIPVIVDSIYGYGFNGWSSEPANGDFVRLALQRVNSAIKTLVSTLGPKVYFIDPVSLGVQQSDGRYTPQCQGFGVQDGIHPNGIAGYLIASAKAAILTENFGASESYYYSGSSFLTDPFFVTTTTDANGTYSTALTINAVNATFTNRQIETINGKIYQTGLMTVTAAGSNVNMRPAITSFLADIVANTGWYGVEFDYFVQQVSGDIRAIDALERLDITKTGAGRVVLDQAINGLISGAIYKCVMPLVQYQDSAAALKAASNGLMIQITQNNALTPAGQQYKIGISLPRLIKQT